MVQDPVCGMLINKEEAVAKDKYKGAEYYFCSLSCRDAFKDDPERYTKHLNSFSGNNR